MEEVEKIYEHKMPYVTTWECSDPHADDVFFHISGKNDAIAHIKETGHEVRNFRTFGTLFSPDEDIDWHPENIMY